MTTLSSYLQERTEWIEKELEKLVPPSNGPTSLLSDAARYALLGGGKRLRPLLTLAAAEMLGGPADLALTPACALELIHTYSLIHDDLPCMDDDDYRRGKPTVHKVYGEGYAVLTGDFLLTRAFEVLAQIDTLSQKDRIELIRLLAKNAGGEGMIGGQVMDLLAEETPAPLEILEQLHRKKTGALIATAVEFGSLVGKASASHRKSLRLFGEQIGLAFQIIDDLLDAPSSHSSSDQLNQKSTYVSLLGLDRAKEMALTLQNQAEQTLNSLPYDTGRLKEITTYIIGRTY